MEHYTVNWKKNNEITF